MLPGSGNGVLRQMSNRRKRLERPESAPLDPRDRRLRANLTPARQQQQTLVGQRFVGKRNIVPDLPEEIGVAAQDDALDSLGRR